MELLGNTNIEFGTLWRQTQKSEHLGDTHTKTEHLRNVNIEFGTLVREIQKSEHLGDTHT